MGSGKYSALAGAIAREQSIANITNNLANISTSGYKKSRVSFESILDGQGQIDKAKGINYNRVRNNFTDFSPGALKATENPLDVAISGQGFFKVQGENGTLYTRRGDFSLTSEGLLITSNGLSVLDDGNNELSIPDTDISRIAFGDDGTIYVLGPQGTRQQVGRLGIVDIEDTTQLKRESDTTFSMEDANLEIPSDSSTLVQGSLEISNINMSMEMAKMIDSYRLFETYHKILDSYGTLGEQQQELGTLG